MSPITSDVTNSLSVCSCLCIVLKWQMILTRSLLHLTTPCLFQSPDHIKIWLTSVNPLQILPQSDPPAVDLSIGDIWWQIVTEWLKIVQRSQWRAYGKPPSLFRMIPVRLPLLPKWGSQMHPNACCHLVNMIEYIDKAAVSCAGCHYELNDVAFCQVTLALVFKNANDTPKSNCLVVFA